MENYAQIDAYLDAHLDDSIVELSRFAAQPSVAAQNWGLEECAQMVSEMLQARGFSAEILPTGGSPVVVAERQGRDSSKTLLFYNSTFGRRRLSSLTCVMASFLPVGSVMIKAT